MSFLNAIPGLAFGGLFNKNFRKGLSSTLFGDSAKNSQVSLLGKEQQPLYEQLLAAGQNRGAGGAFGTSADYYRDLLSNDSEDYQRYAAPEMRQFREEIIPELSEQFAGMGSGGLSSSGFRNAAVNAGASLAERLGAIRANLRQQGAQGLADIGQFGLNRFYENVHTPARPGLLQSAAPAIGKAAVSSYMGTPSFNQNFGSTSPYGGSNFGDVTNRNTLNMARNIRG